MRTLGLILIFLVMTDSKIYEEVEEQDFSSFYRVDVYRQNRYYAMLDPNDPEEQTDIPFSGTDYFAVEKVYSVYMLDAKQVSDRVKEAVEKEDNLYCIRVYHLPLNSIVLDEESQDVTVFDSKGDCSGHRSFNAGEIVEYHDLKEDVVRLAVVYDAPKSKKDCEGTEDSDDDLYDQEEEDYKLLTEGSDWMYIPASSVARPTFPVSDAFKEKLESVYKMKVEDVKNGRLSFGDLLNLL